MSTVSATFQGDPVEIYHMNFTGSTLHFAYRDPADGHMKANRVNVAHNTSASTIVFDGATINL